MPCRRSIHYFIEISARNHIFLITEVHTVTETHTVHPVGISVLRKLTFLHHEEILSPVLAMLCLVVLCVAGIVFSGPFRTTQVKQ